MRKIQYLFTMLLAIGLSMSVFAAPPKDKDNDKSNEKAKAAKAEKAEKASKSEMGEKAEKKEKAGQEASVSDDELEKEAKSGGPSKVVIPGNNDGILAAIKERDQKIQALAPGDETSSQVAELAREVRDLANGLAKKNRDSEPKSRRDLHQAVLKVVRSANQLAGFSKGKDSEKTQKAAAELHKSIEALGPAVAALKPAAKPEAKAEKKSGGENKKPSGTPQATPQRTQGTGNRNR